MSGMTRAAVAAVVLLAGEVGAMETASLAGTDLGALRWQARPIVVLAEADDPRRAEQLTLFAAEEASMDERQMRVLTGSPAEGRALLGEAVEGTFAVLLIGKDGGIKARHDVPVAPAVLFDLVDTMPMRRNEAGGN